MICRKKLKKIQSSAQTMWIQCWMLVIRRLSIVLSCNLGGLMVNPNSIQSKEQLIESNITWHLTQGAQFKPNSISFI